MHSMLMLISYMAILYVQSYAYYIPIRVQRHVIAYYRVVVSYDEYIFTVLPVMYKLSKTKSIIIVSACCKVCTDAI